VRSMNHFGASWTLGACLTMGLALLVASQSRAEDGIDFAVDCGGACGIGTLTSSDLLLAAVPGGKFVITVAHLAPSPEDAFVRGRPIKCSPVEFRVDTLRIGGRDGLVDVELGYKQELAAGESLRIVRAVDPNQPGVGPDMDQLTFRLRAAKVSHACNLIASGMFFGDDASAPTPFSLLVDDGRKGLGRVPGH